VVRWLATAAFVALVALSAGRMLVATAVQPEVGRVDDPFADYLLPLWREDRVAVNADPFYTGGNKEPKFAWNLGERMGLSGRASLLPLGVFVIAAGAWVAMTVIRRPPPAATGI
jgi:hypothetical protein